MKERGIIFNAEMVRAILDGRKTQTRRPIKWKQTRCTEIGERDDGSYWPWSEDCENCCDYWHPCPFGQPGDRIWVRETFQGPLVSEELFEEYRAYPEKFEIPQYCEYAADGGSRPEYCDLDDNLRHGWKPSIHMPRWASRITLEITGVRVERLQNISQKDAISEGGPPSHPSIDAVSQQFGYPDFSRSWFGQTWQHIYGEESWQANPWVWAITFRRVK